MISRGGVFLWALAGAAAWGALAGCSRPAKNPGRAARASQTPRPSPGGTLADPSPGFNPDASAGAARAQQPGPVPVVDPRSLTRAPSGPGILVCEPVVRGADPPTAALGAGCARWLHFWLAASGECGRTPMWTSVDRARRAMGRPDLRLTLKEAVRLPASLGISHVALGEIQGKGGRCALTYQLVDLSTRKGVGASLVARGSEAELVAGLPGLLRQLCARLGVKPPQAPATVSESAADLQALGRMPWRPDETIPQKWLDLLDGLSRRSALGALLFLINRGDVQDARVAREAADLLRKQAPGHPLALAEIGRQFQTASAGPPGLETAPGLARFPNSYLLATAAMWQHREAGDFAAARKAGEQAVRCSLQNPQAWLDLGGVFRGQADFLRRGRVVGELSPGERDYCRKLYVLWLKMAAQAARIDPGNSAAWGQVSNAAAFAGQGKVADSAFWKAVALEQENPLPDDPGLYNWGLELYHPLWYEDRAKAARVAKLAAAEAASAGDKWPPSARVDLALALHLDGFPVLAAGMVRTAWERAALKKAIAENQDQDGAPEAGETGSEEEQ